MPAVSSPAPTPALDKPEQIQPEHVEPQAHPEQMQALPMSPGGAAAFRRWWAAVPLEAVLPMVAIVIVLLVMLALMG